MLFIKSRYLTISSCLYLCLILTKAICACESSYGSNEDHYKENYQFLSESVKEYYPKLSQIKAPEDEETASNLSDDNSAAHVSYHIKDNWSDLFYYQQISGRLKDFLFDLKRLSEKQGILFRNKDAAYKKFIEIKEFYSTNLKYAELVSQSEKYYSHPTHVNAFIEDHINILSGICMIIDDTNDYIKTCKQADFNNLKEIEPTIIIISNLKRFFSNHTSLMGLIFTHELKKLILLTREHTPYNLNLSPGYNNSANYLLSKLVNQEKIIDDLIDDLDIEKKQITSKSSPRSSVKPLSTLLNFSFNHKTSPDNSPPLSSREK